MLPFQIPANVSPRDYLLKLVPEAHRSLVPAASAEAGKTWDVAIALPGDKSVLYSIDGSALTVVERPSDDAAAHLVVTLPKSDLARFLADFGGPRRYVPSFSPRGAALITDPRVVARAAMVMGSMEATIPDFEGGPVTLAIAAFGGKRGSFDRRDDAPDASVELPSATFEQLLSGRLAPDKALTAGGVVLKGKKLVAMQFAFALAPFFPL